MLQFMGHRVGHDLATEQQLKDHDFRGLRSLSSCFSLFFPPKEKTVISAIVSTTYYLNILCIHGDEGKPDSYRFKAKKQEKTSEKEPNKMKINNLPDRELKLMVINMLTKHRE